MKSFSPSALYARIRKKGEESLIAISQLTASVPEKLENILWRKQLNVTATVHAGSFH